MEPIPMAPVRVDPPPAAQAPAASVNGVDISAQDIAAEAQNHPAPTPDQAVEAATRALVIRELLLQRARELELSPAPETDDAGRRETDEDALARQVLETEIDLPQADDDVCQRYYDNNRHRFTSPVLYEAAHILFSASPDDKQAYAAATSDAEQVLAAVVARPAAFGELAREHSACPSGKNGGNLGQVSQGDTVAEVETFLDNLADGQVCPVPVKSRYGVHVLRLDRRIDGRSLPFDMVRERIASYLQEASWRRAVAQYVKILVGQADIKGVDLEGASTPLVR